MATTAHKPYDFPIALVIWFMASPVIVLIAMLVWLWIGPPVIYRQWRPGLRGKPFRICKFRSMNNKRDAKGRLLEDAERLNRFGDLLRRTSLDELPELFNVLKGEMSLVGPRPLLMEYLPRYSPEQMKRHNAKPGITGWAQVNGRNAISWEEKFKLDNWYVQNQSFGLDIKILLITILVAFQGKGIQQPGHATSEKFCPAASAKDNKRLESSSEQGYFQ